MMEQNDFSPEFIAKMAATDPTEMTPEVTHHAAAGMTLLLWRNTSTVETDAHAEGDWENFEMLRLNTRVTRLLWDALTEFWMDPEDGEEVLLDAMRGVCDPLPTEAMRDSLWGESHRKAAFWGSAIRTFTPDRVLPLFTGGPPGLWMTCNRDWWGHPDYPARIAWLATIDPPDPETFTEQALDEPGDLSDEQASFIVDHRYDRSPAA